MASAVARVGEWAMSWLPVQEEDRDAAAHERSYASYELALVRLRRVAALVGVARDEHEVGFVARRVVDDLIEDAKEVDKPCGKAQVRTAVDARREIRG